MKNYVLLSICLLFTVSPGIFAQDVIPNHSFESWDDGPVSWTNPLLFAGVDNVVPSSDSQHGTLSAKLFAIWDDNSSMFLPATMNSLIIPVTGQNISLKGFFKGTSIEGDIFSVTVFFYLNSEVIGSGEFYSSETVSSWTEFTVPINYTSAVTPANAYIYIIVAGQNDLPHDGTEYMVDNLSWEGPSGYSDLQVVKGVSAAPNPATDHLDLQFTLPEADDFSFEVVTSQGEVQSLIGKNKFTAGLNSHRFDTHGLVPGMYMLRAQGAKYSFVQKFVVGR